MAMEYLKDLNDLSEEIYKSIKKSNSDLKNSCQSKLSRLYAKKLYKCILKISSSCINLLENEDYSAIPLLVRNMIESIVDLANLRLYGDEYAKHLEFIYILNEIDFMNKNYRDYTKYLAPDDENRDVEKIKQKLYDQKKKMVLELKEIKTEGLNYIDKCINNNEIVYKELKFYLSQKHKFYLLLHDENLKKSKFKAKKERHKMYIVGYYLMSKFIHNSIEFTKDYKPGENLDSYANIISSILKNGLHYLSDIYQVEIEDKKFKKLSKLKKEIRESGFYIDYDMYYEEDMDIDEEY